MVAQGAPPLGIIAPLVTVDGGALIGHFWLVKTNFGAVFGRHSSKRIDASRGVTRLLDIGDMRIKWTGPRKCDMPWWSPVLSCFRRLISNRFLPRFHQRILA